jgi:hypothetical protein
VHIFKLGGKEKTSFHLLTGLLLPRYVHSFILFSVLDLFVILYQSLFIYNYKNALTTLSFFKIITIIIIIIDKPNRKGIQALSQLTMSESEEQMFIQYCDSHSGLTREVGQEFLIMYYVERSRFMEAIRMHRKRLVVEREKDEKEQFHRAAIDRRNSRQLGGHQIGTQPSQSLSKSQKRQVLIDQLMKVLPAPQRLILELEEEKQQGDSKSRTGAHATTTTRAPLTSYLSFNTGRDVQQGQGGKKSEFAAGGQGIQQVLLDMTDGAPSTSLKGLDLGKVTGSLTGEEEAVAQGEEGQTMPVDDLTEEKDKVSAVEIMELD